MDKSLLLAAEDSDCLSSRLRVKAQALRTLSNNAKNWEYDIKRASQNLKQKIEQSQFNPPMIQITPPFGNNGSKLIFLNINFSTFRSTIPSFK